MTTASWQWLNGDDSCPIARWWLFWKVRQHRWVNRDSGVSYHWWCPDCGAQTYEWERPPRWSWRAS